jgi:hypothetical protein
MADLPIPTTLACYAESPEQTALSLAKIFASTTTNPKDTTMPAAYPNYTGISDFPKAAAKRFVSGINGSSSINSMLGALNSLGLCSDGLISPLTTLAAHGQANTLGKYLQIDLHALDRALAQTESSTSNKLAFKCALSLMGFLA